ncbi:MAG: FtsX-like permease family protein, partial [Candidatus Latescibacteria bacterium]|nr:FtsX-like permease family protein [Candidatus Latescibacterota bacterium]
EGARFQVIGVFSKYNFFKDTNERNLVGPYTTAQKRFAGNDRLNQINVGAVSPEYVDVIAERIRAIIKRHHKHGEDFQVRTGEEQIGTFNRVVTIMKIVAGGIAGISLLVGGMGIMNIMLVSVSERTREIGVRKALGAKRRTILWQFVVEAIVLCLFGGALGILLGLGIGAGISAYVKSLTEMPFESIVTPGLMIFAIVYSAVIGLFFGVYPAYRASKLDPIDALRYE